MFFSHDSRYPAVRDPEPLVCQEGLRCIIYCDAIGDDVKVTVEAPPLKGALSVAGHMMGVGLRRNTLLKSYYYVHR